MSQPPRKQLCPACNKFSCPVADVGCVECLALAAPHRLHLGNAWSDAQLDIIEQFYGVVSTAEVQHRIYVESGVLRTQRAIRCRAGVSRVLASDNGNGVTAAEAGRMLGYSRGAISEWVRRKKLYATGRGNRWYIPLEEVHRLAAQLIPSEPVISRREAMDRLGYSNSKYFSALLRAGAIRSYKSGTTRVVSLAAVEEVERRLRETGDTRVFWKLGRRVEDVARESPTALITSPQPARRRLMP